MPRRGRARRRGICSAAPPCSPGGAGGHGRACRRPGARCRWLIGQGLGLPSATARAGCWPSTPAQTASKPPAPVAVPAHPRPAGRRASTSTRRVAGRTCGRTPVARVDGEGRRKRTSRRSSHGAGRGRCAGWARSSCLGRSQRAIAAHRRWSTRRRWQPASATGAASTDEPAMNVSACRPGPAGALNLVRPSPRPFLPPLLPLYVGRLRAVPSYTSAALGASDLRRGAGATLLAPERDRVQFTVGGEATHEKLRRVQEASPARDPDGSS